MKYIELSDIMEKRLNMQKNLVSDINCKTSKYFGINIEQNWYTYNVSMLLDLKEMNIISNQNIVNRQELNNILTKLFGKTDLKYTQIYVSEKTVALKDIKDSTEKIVFSNEANTEGWLIFIDPMAIANWSHRCEYWFIINEEKIYKRLNEQWKPKVSVKLKEFNINLMEN